MIRQTMRPVALALAGLLLASGAWGQVLRQETSAAQNLALEYFGGEARTVQVSKFDLAADAGVQRPYVALRLTGGTINAGNVAEITFTLAGATFDQAASPSNLDQWSGAACTGTKGNQVEASVLSGGARGDTTVTYRVETTDAAGTVLATDQRICFWIPDLSVTLTTVSAPGVTPAVKGVSVTASIKPTTDVGDGFPATIHGQASGDTTDGPGPITMKNIFVAKSAIVASLGTGETGLVNVADRTKIAKGGEPDPSVSGTGATMGLKVGTLSITLAQGGTIWKLEGGTDPNDSNVPHPGKLGGATLDSTLSGQVKLSVGGRFQSGDKVVVGSGPTALIGTPSDGTAEVTASLETGTKTIVYVPGGVDALKPGKFAAGGAFLFNDRRNNNAAIMPMSTGEIKYDGVEVEGYAYGVVRGGASDSSFVRVTCEEPAECKVFLDCRGEDGMDYFNAAPSVPAGDTMAWSSADIAGVLGFTGNERWDGRGRCEILSTGHLSVQHMVRSGGILVNSSAVVGRGQDERDGANASDIASVKAVVDKICRSVGDAADATDRDGDTTGTQLTACYTQPPWTTVPTP